MENKEQIPEVEKKNNPQSVFFFLFVFVLIGVYFYATRKDEVESVPTVQWESYDPIVKVRIDSLVKNKDCKGLQEEFDVSADNSTRHYEKTGVNNLKLMDYLDYELKSCGCYKK
jgi:hypothetical protein